jgi:hypothetical protein
MTFTITLKVTGRTIFADAVRNDSRITVDEIHHAIEFLSNELAAVSATTIAGFEVTRN